MLAMKVAEFTGNAVRLAAAAMLVAGCSGANREGSVSPTHTLLDVTSASTRIKLGKRFGLKLVNTESYWEDQETEEMTRCYHGFNEFTRRTGPGIRCESFERSSHLEPTASLIGMNMGAGQRTESVWKESDGYRICEHTRSFWGGRVPAQADSCRPWDLGGIEPGWNLVTVNSGKYEAAESTWVHQSGDVRICHHDKDGFWRRSFGQLDQCRVFEKPGSLFPAGVISPTLEAINSDEDQPIETYWRDQENNALITCKYWRDRGILQNWTGEPRSCTWWQAPVELMQPKLEQKIPVPKRRRMPR